MHSLSMLSLRDDTWEIAMTRYACPPLKYHQSVCGPEAADSYLSLVYWNGHFDANLSTTVSLIRSTLHSYIWVYTATVDMFSQCIDIVSTMPIFSILVSCTYLFKMLGYIHRTVYWFYTGDFPQVYWNCFDHTANLSCLGYIFQSGTWSVMGDGIRALQLCFPSWTETAYLHRLICQITHQLYCLG